MFFIVCSNGHLPLVELMAAAHLRDERLQVSFSLGANLKCQSKKPIGPSGAVPCTLSCWARPGVMDVVGRAKFDAWMARKGAVRETAMAEYVALVTRLKAVDSA